MNGSEDEDTKESDKKKKINSGRLLHFRSVGPSQQSLAVFFSILNLSSIVSQSVRWRKIL